MFFSLSQGSIKHHIETLSAMDAALFLKQHLVQIYSNLKPLMQLKYIQGFHLFFHHFLFQSGFCVFLRFQLFILQSYVLIEKQSVLWSFSQLPSLNRFAPGCNQTTIEIPACLLFF